MASKTQLFVALLLVCLLGNTLAAKRLLFDRSAVSNWASQAKDSVARAANNVADTTVEVSKKVGSVAVVVGSKAKEMGIAAGEKIGEGYQKVKDTYEEKVPESVKTAAAAVGATVAGAAVTGGAVAAAGFSSIGPVAGSLAAAAQASVGSVAAGGVFATVQSAAMTVAGGIVGGPILIIGAAVGGTLYGAYSFFKYICSSSPEPQRQHADNQAARDAASKQNQGNGQKSQP